jgi:hypothetical protein
MLCWCRGEAKRNGRWLRTDVVAAYDALRANPKCAVPLGQVRDGLAAEYAKTKQKK